MKHPSAWLLGLVLALTVWPAGSAEPLNIAQTEVNYLLGFIERSGCQFYRNGSWYDSKRAQEHLRTKKAREVPAELPNEFPTT